MELAISWMEEGRQQGLEQGLEQGRQQEALSLVTRQIERRFGPLDASMRERIARLSLEQLESLGEALLDFKTIENLADWLEQNADGTAEPAPDAHE